MSKNVKITPAYKCRDDVQSVWGVKFVKNKDGVHVGEVDADLAKEMIDLGRAAKYEAPKKAAKKAETPPAPAPAAAPNVAETPPAPAPAAVKK